MQLQSLWSMHYHYGPYSMKNSNTNIIMYFQYLYHTPYVYERNMLILNTITDLTVHEYIPGRSFLSPSELVLGTRLIPV